MEYAGNDFAAKDGPQPSTEAAAVPTSGESTPERAFPWFPVVYATVVVVIVLSVVLGVNWLINDLNDSFGDGDFLDIDIDPATFPTTTSSPAP